MDSIKEMLEKIAVSNKKTINMTEKAKKEIELINKVKTGATHEANFATKQLVKMYRNVIGQQAKESGLSSVVDPNIAHTFGVKILRDSISKYDPSKGVQPNTYFQTNLNLAMRKEMGNHVDFAAKKTAELTQKNSHVIKATNLLRMQLGREPSNREIHSFITNELGKSVELKNIERIKSYNRNEYSGNARIGEDTNADFMTLMDIVNVDPVTPEQSYVQDLEKREWLEAIKKFPSKKERRFLYSVLGLGEFEGNAEKSINAAATNNNMSVYEAKKVRDKFLDMVRSKPQI